MIDSSMKECYAGTCANLANKFIFLGRFSWANQSCHVLFFYCSNSFQNPQWIALKKPKPWIHPSSCLSGIDPIRESPELQYNTASLRVWKEECHRTPVSPGTTMQQTVLSPPTWSTNATIIFYCGTSFASAQLYSISFGRRKIVWRKIIIFINQFLSEFS